MSEFVSVDFFLGYYCVSVCADFFALKKMCNIITATKLEFIRLTNPESNLPHTSSLFRFAFMLRPVKQKTNRITFVFIRV